MFWQLDKQNGVKIPSTVTRFCGNHLVFGLVVKYGDDVCNVAHEPWF